MQLIVYGLVKKVVVADNLAILVDVVFALDHPPAPLIVVATLCFGFQIYADFSGYSDIARGSAKLLGIELMRNFDLPYFSRSASEFWKRWHISLSEWIRDYVYIPLVGARSKKSRRYVNLIAAMTLSGLWHGASMNFVTWGFYHALLLLFYKEVIDRISLIKRLPTVLSAPFLWVLCMGLVFYGWLLFRIRDASTLIDLHATLLDLGGWSVGWADAAVVACLGCMYAVPLYIFEATQFAARDSEAWVKWHWAVRVLACTIMILTILLFGVEDHAAFIYFQF